MSELTATTIEQQISAIIDEHVRPYIEMDGGSIEFTRYESNIVYVRLSGACNTCPSSSLTLKGGVERQIRRRLPEVLSVEMEGSGSIATGEPAGTTVLRY
jgi:NFU1 iron-sulfur cluster scaffold homolog, mitochondrial